MQGITSLSPRFVCGIWFLALDLQLTVPHSWIIHASIFGRIYGRVICLVLTLMPFVDVRQLLPAASNRAPTKQGPNPEFFWWILSLHNLFDRY